MEHWKPISDFPTYEISSMGRVRRIAGGRWGQPGRILKNGDRGKGYLRVMLRYSGTDRTAFVHELVATAFLGKRPTPKHEAAHLDGNRNNNQLCNLKWVTSKENHAHQRHHGTQPLGECHAASKLTATDVLAIRRSTDSHSSVARQFGVSSTHVARIRKQTVWRHLA